MRHRNPVKCNATGPAAWRASYRYWVLLAWLGAAATAGWCQTAPALQVSPSNLSFVYVIGDSAPGPQTIAVTSSGAPLNFSVASSGGVSITPTSGTTPSTITVSVNTAGVSANQVYLSTIYIAAPGAGNGTQQATVSFAVGAPNTGTALKFSPTDLSFAYETGGSPPPAQDLTITSLINGATLGLRTSATSTGNWLSISPSTGTTGTYFVVSANPAGLSAGSYSGLISVAYNGIGVEGLPAPSGTQTVAVTLVVSTPSSLAGSATNLNFAFQTGGSPPGAQNLTVSSTGSPLNFNATATSTGNWLAVSPVSGTTPAVLAVSVNPNGLAAGSYSGDISLTTSGAAAGNQLIPVTLVVSPPGLSANAQSLSFTFGGGATPGPQNLRVSSTGADTAFTAAATGGSWLAVTPASATTPATITVSVSPTGLANGSYSGKLTLTPANGGSAVAVPVILSVTNPLPTASAVVNAASYAAGPISPGEIIDIFDTSLGPAAPVSSTVDAAGKFATTVAGVQVLCNGIPAPILFVSASQVSAIVPYELQSFANPSIWISYSGQTSNAAPVTSAASAPGIFTQDASGSGAAAVLNQDFSLNTAGNPASPGSTIQVFVTGEGQTSPAGVTGQITAVSATPPLTPMPLLPIAVSIGGQSAPVAFYGEAPGAVAGLMQVNAQIPTTVASGPVPIVVTVGANQSQAGVTVFVR